MIKKSISAGAVAPLTRISWWLMPVAEEQGFFANMISQLAGMFDGPLFDPHITVYSGTATSNGNQERILPKVIGHGGEFSLRCTGLKFSEKFTKACFLEFTLEPRLNRLYETIGDNSCQSESYQLDPHLSLFYGNLTAQDQQRIQDMIAIPDLVRFGGLAAMATSAEIRTGRDVESWQQLALRHL